jgi:hypothetical protein
MLAISSGASAGPTTPDTGTYIYTDNGGTDHLWSYGLDSSKYINGETGYSRYACELARDPVKLTSGPYAGGYEYMFDLYLFDGFGATGTTYEIGGLDNSKIMNIETSTLLGAATNSPGRIQQIWSWGTSANQANANELQAPSYDDGAGGWTDAGLGYGWTYTDNPHSYSEYQLTGSVYWGERRQWYLALDLLNQGEDLSYWYSGVTNAASDQIVISRYEQGVSGGAHGLIFTLRVVYQDPIIPTYMGGTDDLWWSFASYGAGAKYNILGEYDVFVGIPGDFDGDGDVDDADIDILSDAIGAGSSDLTYDVNGDSVVDENDLVDHIATLVERTDGGVGTYRGDFNLDGFVNGTDLAIFKASFGLSGLGYASGNCNTDDFINGTDLAIFKATFGFSGTPGEGGNPPAVPEPATVALLALGATGLAARRRRE